MFQLFAIGLSNIHFLSEKNEDSIPSVKIFIVFGKLFEKYFVSLIKKDNFVRNKLVNIIVWQIFSKKLNKYITHKNSNT
jgi:hypothetical protein